MSGKVLTSPILSRRLKFLAHFDPPLLLHQMRHYDFIPAQLLCTKVPVFVVSSLGSASPSPREGTHPERVYRKASKQISEIGVVASANQLLCETILDQPPLDGSNAERHLPRHEAGFGHKKEG